jgi:DNA (cytosine-5)-methyltransferase 1
MRDAVPIIDLFAGPGGLGEGFSSIKDSRGRAKFRIGVSIEKDPAAHATLLLRAVFRRLRDSGAIESYMEFAEGRSTYEQFLSEPRVKDAYKHANSEAKCAELGKSDPAEIDAWIGAAIGSRSDWVLIGGPPCQAYSLAGRSRRKNDAAFADDEKHFLYREYLRIIRKFRPAVFVMENVKGLLSSKHEGTSMFARIIDDLSQPTRGCSYDIRSFVKATGVHGYEPADYVIRSELFGIPQARHRVIFLGVRQDYAQSESRCIPQVPSTVPVSEMLRGLPQIRSRISKRHDSFEDWIEVLKGAERLLANWPHESRGGVEAEMRRALIAARRLDGAEKRLKFSGTGIGHQLPTELANWIRHDSPSVPIHHESRSHMDTDLLRYFFAASYAAVTGESAKLQQFPHSLLPAHVNASSQNAPFSDRFRVQLSGRPATTVVSHIAKDGHYYIHPDPSQCRSLTVREAARLQTFPDNYKFMGNRTQQYSQVGNAVPPYLARKLGHIVANML